MAGAIASLEGLILLGAAVYMVIHAASGYRETDVAISGYGTAGWFAIMGTAVTAAGIGLLRGQRWGRGVVVIAQLVLLPVAYYMAIPSGRLVPGICIAIAAIAALVGLFQRRSLAWYAA